VEIEVADVIFAAEDSAKLQPKKAWLNWAKLIRKVYEVDPLKCKQCGETMKLIAFILDATSIQKILSHIGEDSEPQNCILQERLPMKDILKEDMSPNINTIKRLIGEKWSRGMLWLLGKLTHEKSKGFI
jgi:hypothetical protein